MNQTSPRGIERWAMERPDDVAIVEGEHSLTWAELDQLANRVANALAARGVVASDIVVVRTRPRTEWAVIAGAIAKLGCSMLGLNWRLTPAEGRHVIEDSRATILVCDDADPAPLADLVKDPVRLAVSIDTPADGFISYADLLEGSPDQRYAKADPRLIIYTSGTTGTPKGIVMNQSAGADEKTMREFLEGRDGYVRFSDRDATLINMPFHHAAGPAQFWTSVRQGNKVVLQRRFNPTEALELIARHRISHWTAVPTMFKRIAALPAEVLSAADVSSIGQIRIGTAPVPLELKTWVLDYFGDDVLHEVYGASECGLVATLPPSMQRKKPGSCGHLLPHVQLEVRDAQGNSLPAGQQGELWVRTPVAIRSYLNAPPLGTDTLDAAGFFRTGDVGYMDEDGYLFITDRAKDMIISGGVNIFPAEIEAALQKHPAVLDAAVIGIPDDEFGEQVLAFCELKPGQQTDEATLLAHCVPLLASYKRPRRIEFMPELPRNPMGKLLKRELREPYWKGRERQV